MFASIVARGIKFPPPTGLRINMMPIVIGDVKTLPQECRPYLPLLRMCPLPSEEWGKVGYLTIDESVVEEGASQRRGGLHTESPGGLGTAGIVGGDRCDGGKFQSKDEDDARRTLGWGWGYAVYYDDSGCVGNYNGGIFMASNVASSTRVWNAAIVALDEVVRPVRRPGAHAPLAWRRRSSRRR